MEFLLPALGILAFLTVISLIIKEKSETLKYVLFGGTLTVIVGYTAYLAWSTISVNTRSITKGPVHWHADFQIWDCGQRVDLINPTGLDNKIGTSLLHEHNDERIHVEGPVMDYQGITLGNFFKVVGGNMEEGLLSIPTNNGLLTMSSGSDCNGQMTRLQVFVYSTKDEIFKQQKISNPWDYVLSPHSGIPPGDCIIVELDKLKDKTDKICTFYEIARQKGEIHD